MAGKDPAFGEIGYPGNYRNLGPLLCPFPAMFKGAGGRGIDFRGEIVCEEEDFQKFKKGLL